MRSARGDHVDAKPWSVTRARRRVVVPSAAISARPPAPSDWNAIWSVLVVSNAVPLLGVAFLGWSLMSILVLYWLENGIVGFYNIFKILTARGTLASEPDSTTSTSTPTVGAVRTLAGNPPGGCLAPFFVVHYGIFWMVHGVFVFLLPVFAGIGSLARGGSSSAAAFGAIDPAVVTIGAITMFVSHGVSFALNWIGRREYERVAPSAQMLSVYGRVVVLHLTILGGAFLVGALGAPIAALLVMVVLKTIIDIGLHLREHARTTPAGATTTV